MPPREELSREEEFRAWAALEATRLERFASELREGKWDTYNLQERIVKKGQGQEQAVITIVASRLQALGTGVGSLSASDEKPSEPEPR